MPLTPSSYKKIFKSKYIQDDSDEEAVNDNDTDDLDYKTTTASTSVSTSYSPAYTPPSTSSTYTPRKAPMLTSMYLDTHPELNFSTSTSSYSSGLTSSYLDSLSKTSKPTTSTYPSSSFTRASTSPYSQGLSSPYLESRSLLTPERPLSKLPPLPQRSTPFRRNYDEIAPFSQETTPSRYQRTPLRNLTVVSRSVTPIHSVNRSPSPVDSISWRSNKSITPAPRRIYPQTSATVDLDDLVDKEDAPVVFDANLTFVLGTKGKIKQNLIPIPAHVEKDTASNCLTDKIQDFLKRTDHVMEEWQSMGRKRDDNNNMSVKERALMGRSKSATNIMIKGFQLFSKASSCSRSSLGRDISEDCTEAEADEVYRRNDVTTPYMLPAN